MIAILCAICAIIVYLAIGSLVVAGPYIRTFRKVWPGTRYSFDGDMRYHTPTDHEYRLSIAWCAFLWPFALPVMMWAKIVSIKKSGYFARLDRFALMVAKGRHDDDRASV